MTTVKVSFTMEADDTKHPSGLTNASYEMLMDAVSQVGGYDVETEVEEDDEGS